MPDEQDCTVVHPSLRVTCRLRLHPHERAHFASGTEFDGTQWSLFWWRPADVHADPTGRADQPARRNRDIGAPGTAPVTARS